MDRLISFAKKNRSWLEISLLIFLVTGFVFNLTRKISYFYHLPTDLAYYFFIVLVFLAAYIFLTLNNRDKFFEIRRILIIFIILFLFLSSILVQIMIRKNTGNDQIVHDGLVQTEEAVKFLDQGKNPYLENYLNTNFYQFKNIFDPHLENYAWYHYVYLPFLPIFSWPFYKISINLIGFFDGRMMYILIFITLLYFINKIPKAREDKILLLFLFALNPFLTPYFISGYNELFVIFWLIICFYFLNRGRFILTSVFLGFACISKQHAWAFAPLYLIYLYLYYAQRGITRQASLLKIIKVMLPTIIIFLSVMLPFFLWSPKEFVDDIVRYSNGTIPSNYPISGLGFSQVILLKGWASSRWDYFPFWIIQTLTLIPVLYIFWHFMRKNLRTDYLVFSYAAFLYIFWFFSRAFNQNYFGFIFCLFILALFLKPETAKNDIIPK